jgi:2-polyprenyl-6-methoxyphenol hydroxylase-like FAD-dependent oxidoreductase
MSAAREAEAVRRMSAAPRDVVVAGAGLVGLALAAALARSGITVTLLDRQLPPPSADPETWDARVYAISPGSAAFLQRIGAWQALPCERITAIESMRIEGDTGATLNFSAYELGERALTRVLALLVNLDSGGNELHAPELVVRTTSAA